MHHWDLTPHETVTLSDRTGERLRGRFLFRDTLRASFWIDGEMREFELRDDGGLAERRKVQGGWWRHRWEIQGANRNTRGVAARVSFAPNPLSRREGHKGDEGELVTAAGVGGA